MSSLVNDKLTSLHKLSVAHRARERLVAGVCAHVRYQMRVTHETLVTESTLERPLTVVHPHVLQQVTCLLVRLVALQKITQLITQSLARSIHHHHHHHIFV